jgi:hypothetical protein
MFEYIVRFDTNTVVIALKDYPNEDLAINLAQGFVNRVHGLSTFLGAEQYQDELSWYCYQTEDSQAIYYA